MEKNKFADSTQAAHRMPVIVETSGLSKSYRNNYAVDNISLRLEEGRIYGLLGRNGAGKTTLMHMLTGQLFPTSGSALLFGKDPFTNANVLKQVCFIKESQPYIPHLKIVHILQLAEEIYPNFDREYALELVDSFQLPIHRKMKALSRGMLSAVGIIIGLASRAPLTIFDEPYLGLDAVARQIFYEHLLEDYASHPRTIILSTHLIDEVSKMFDAVVFIDRGKILLQEEIEMLRQRALRISGPRDQVEKIVAGKHVIHRESIGGTSVASILENSPSSAREEARRTDVEVEALPLQQLLIYLTETRRKYVGGARK